MYKTVREAKAILNRILQNTEYTGVYEDPPEKSREPTRRAEPSTQSPTPCPQKISEPNFSTSYPMPFSENHRPFSLSMFDNDESIMYSDVSSSLKEESDADGKSEVVTTDPKEEPLSETDQVKKDSSFPNMEFQFSKDKFEFSDEEFKASISPSSSDPQESYQCLDPFCDSKEKSFLLDPEQSKDFHIEGIDFGTSHEYYKQGHNVENVCSMDTLEAVDSISVSKVSEEHGSFVFEGPQDTYSFDETPSPPAISTHNESNHPMPLHQKNFKRVVVDDFVYHKYCKSRCGLLCTFCS